MRTESARSGTPWCASAASRKLLGSISVKAPRSSWRDPCAPAPGKAMGRRATKRKSLPTTCRCSIAAAVAWVGVWAAMVWVGTWAAVPRRPSVARLGQPRSPSPIPTPWMTSTTTSPSRPSALCARKGKAQALVWAFFLGPSSDYGLDQARGQASGEAQGQKGEKQPCQEKAVNHEGHHAHLRDPAQKALDHEARGQGGGDKAQGHEIPRNGVGAFQEVLASQEPGAGNGRQREQKGKTRAAFPVEAKG